MSAPSSVYGPVHSWRVGRSLGVDLLLVNSVCSFRCVYCQLGRINVHTSGRKVYVPTARVLRDLRASRWREADIITLSGSGEPTLAANVGEVIGEIKRLTGKPVLVLTNATTLGEAEVRRDLDAADKVFCKLDAACEETFRAINRPAEGITLRSVVEGIKAFRAEYSGRLGVQIMLMRINREQADRLAPLLNEIGPDEVQLNAPLRRIPRRWFVGARGDHAQAPPSAVRPKIIGKEVAAAFEARLRDLTGLKIIAADCYRQGLQE